LLIGKAGVGKTTVANLLRDKARYGAFSLAAPLKSDLMRLLRRVPTKADRALMIEYGQAIRRIIGDTVWCEALDNSPGFAECSESKLTVIDDGRHLVEYDYFVVQRGFVPVRIVAPDEIRFERLLTRDGVDQRAVLTGQETELDGVEVSFVIDNSGTLGDLERQVSEMLARINDPSYVAPAYPRMLRIGDRVRLTEEAIQAWTWYEPLQDDLRKTIAVVKDIVDGAYVLVKERNGAWFYTTSKRSNLALVEENGDD
jgi:dephospho-CoA kinase